MIESTSKTARQESTDARTYTLARGRGVTIELDDGTTLLDAASGTFNVPLGYNHPRVVSAIRRQLDRGLLHLTSEYTRERATQLLKPLLPYAPEGITAAWMRDITGSTANECAVRIAQKSTGRHEVISLFLSHHGQTLFTTALSGNAFRRAEFPAGPPTGVKVPAPYCHRCFYGQSFPGCGLMCVDRLDDFIEYASSGSVAAVIVEPVMGNGGNIVPPPGYFERLRQLCDRHGILIIADEVQTGMGRLGEVFGSTAVGLRPDIITLAKGLGGIGVPVAAVLMREELDVLESYEHSFTSGANPLALAAAEATVAVITDDEFLSEVRRKGGLLGQELQRLAKSSDLVSDVRGLGMMWGLEFSGADGSPAPKVARQVIDVARSHEDLILRPSRYGFGNVVKVRPALTVEDHEIADIAQRLERVLVRVEHAEGKDHR
ncbi:aminotransferase class III-fold pyridoxal phosphate-dependent enzyme [Kitasatospora sp. NPDC001603]|uniref:aspartate aminotransferase family protein n=1 Tax=Kitasatospora sp. NPDC001603 TaxID=3154388 RepID=UPI00332A6F52